MFSLIKKREKFDHMTFSRLTHCLQLNAIQIWS